MWGAQMAQFSNILSEVGSVSPLSTLKIPMDLKEGTKIGNWTVPFNIQGVSTADIFREFGLWQSSLGVCISGINHTTSKDWTVTTRTHRPVLVGDRVNGKWVIRASNWYNNRSRLWEVSVVWGIPQPPLELTPGQYEYLKNLHGHMKNQGELTVQLLDDFMTKVLSQYVAGPYPLTPLPTAMPQWQALKAAYENDIAQTLDAVEATEWQIF